MTDLEICMRIAEIEGYNVSTDVKLSCGSAYVNIHPNNCYGNYNPLTDKALCFDLMVKYDVVFLDDEAYAGCESGAGPESGGYYCEGYGVSTSSPQKAICLAIIDKMSGKS